MPIKRGKDGVRRHFHHIVKKDGNPGLVQVKKEEYEGSPTSILPSYLSHGGQGADAFPYSQSGARFTNAFGRDWAKHHYPTKAGTKGALRWKLVAGEPRRRRVPGPQPKRKRRTSSKTSILPSYGGQRADAFPYSKSGARFTNAFGRDWAKHHYPTKAGTKGALRWKLVAGEPRRRRVPGPQPKRKRRTSS
jgi:anti-sigma factor RsiW